MVMCKRIPYGEKKCIHSPTFEFQYNHCNISFYIITKCIGKSFCDIFQCNNSIVCQYLVEGIYLPQSLGI